MEFVKAHGTGNDFVLLPDFDDRLVLDETLTRSLCDRHLGLGADGVIRLAPGEGDADVFMDYRNADGSLAEMCGNGVRCVAKYVADRSLVAGDVVRVATRGGVKPVTITARHPDGGVAEVQVDMGPPEPGERIRVDVSPLRAAALSAAEAVGTTVTADQRTVEVLTLSMGNPHAVVVVADLADAPVRTWGPVIEGDSAFPHGTNVEFITVPSPDRVHGRIWERGVGETMASGTGACAMAAAAHLLGLAGRSVVVTLPGGELAVTWTETTVLVTGPAVEVASGRLTEAWLAARAEGPRPGTRT